MPLRVSSHRATVRSITRLLLVSACAGALIPAGKAYGLEFPSHPSVAKGFDSTQIYDVGSVDSVSLLSGGLSLRIPLGGRRPVGTGVSFGLDLIYSSSVWDFAPAGPSTRANPDPLSNAGLGWRLSLGALLEPGDPTRTDTNPVNPGESHPSWAFLEPDGSDHVLTPRLGTLSTGPDCSSGSACYSNDGTYLRMTQEGFEQVVVDDEPMPLPRRVVSYPTGLRYVFLGFPGDDTDVDWRLRAIAGPFATILDPDVEVEYSCQGKQTSCEQSRAKWVITGRFNRAWTVLFKQDPTQPGEEHAVVGEVQVREFGGGIASYHLDYPGDETLGGVPLSVARPCGDTDPSTPATFQVATLGRVRQPDGSFYAAEYDLTGTGPGTYCRAAGAIRLLRLPTGGRVRWNYRERSLPVEGCSGREWHNRFAGVQSRRLETAGGVDLGTWTYIPQMSNDIAVPPGITCEDGGHPIRAQPEQLRVTVVNPLLDRTTYYFSVYPGASFANSSPFVPEEYGLPFSRFPDKQDGSFPPRFLSSEVFDCSATGACPATPVRQTYVRYERDFGVTPCGVEIVPACRTDNHRLASERIVFRDDPPGCLAPDGTGSGPACHWAATDSSDFDDLGHYRVRAQSSSYTDFQASALTERTGWNPRVPPSGPNPPPPTPSEPWILGIFTYREKSSEKRTFREEYDFNTSDGFLNSVRLLTHTGEVPRRQSSDLLVQYAKRSDGLLGSEAWSGGDCKRNSLTACSPSPAATPAYVFSHDYQFGVRNSTKVQANGHDLNLLALTIDEATGLVATSQDAGGVATNYDYDEMGRLTQSQTIGAAAHVFSYSVPTWSSPLDPLQVHRTVTLGDVLEDETWHFDDLGRSVRHEALTPEGIRGELKAYNGMGWPTFISERIALNATTTSGPGTQFLNYDVFGRPGGIVAADGSEAILTYRGISRIDRTRYVGAGTSQAPLGTERTTVEHYDALGQLRQVTEPNNKSTRYKYDAVGHLKQVHPVSSEQTSRFFTYDGRGFLKAEEHPENGRTEYLYDAAGNPARTLTPTGTLLATYDEASRPLELHVATGQNQTSLLKKYDYFDHLSGTSQGKLREALASNWRKAGGQCVPYDVTDVFTYDDSARVESKETRLTNNLMPKEKWKQSYTYDGAGRLTTLAYPNCTANCTSTARSVETVFEYGRPVHIKDPSTAPTGPVFASEITYNENGTVASVVHGGARFELTPDPFHLQRPLSMAVVKVANASTIWSSGDYQYDRSGNILQIGAGPQVRKFTYDSLSRLRSAEIPAAGSKDYQSYTYDRYGNLTGIYTGTGPGDAAAEGPGFNIDPATNRLKSCPAGSNPSDCTGAATYTASGSVLTAYSHQFEWDPLQQMATVNTGSEYWVHTYDATGQRVWSWRPAAGGQTRVDTYSLRDLGGTLLREYERLNAAPTVTWQDYIYREGQLLASVKPGNVLRFFDLDHLGSVRLVTDANGNEVKKHDGWPYGQEFTAQDDGEQMRFTGHERDLGLTEATTLTMAAQDDLDYMHARYYKAIWGRFLSVDPAGGGPKSPLSWNRYAYVTGNPLARIDPDGLFGTNAVNALYSLGQRAEEAQLQLDYRFFETVDAVPADPTTMGSIGERQPARKGSKRQCGAGDKLMRAISPVSIGANVPLRIPRVPVLIGNATLTAKSSGSVKLYIGAGIGLPLAGSTSHSGRLGGVSGGGGDVSGWTMRLSGSSPVVPQYALGAAGTFAVQLEDKGADTGHSWSAGAAPSGNLPSFSGTLGYTFNLLPDNPDTDCE